MAIGPRAAVIAKHPRLRGLQIQVSHHPRATVRSWCQAVQIEPGGDGRSAQIKSVAARIFERASATLEIACDRGSEKSHLALRMNSVSQKNDGFEFGAGAI